MKNARIIQGWTLRDISKVVHPKYYKDANESFTFAVFGQIGPSGKAELLQVGIFILNPQRLEGPL